MLTILIAMLAVLLLRGLVATYVALPHRGADVSGAPWLGAAMNRATDASGVHGGARGRRRRALTLL